MLSVIRNYKANAIASFLGYKSLAEKAFDQVDEEEFFVQIDEESNSIAVLVKHISGNQISRFTDFLTTDGEKSDRNRDSEFITGNDDRESLMARWEKGWENLISTLNGLDDGDFSKTVMIRGEDHTVVEAINRQLTHYSYHVGQIVFLAKHLKSADWKTLSVPRNRSREFNEFLERKKKRGKERSSPLDGPAEFLSREGDKRK